MTYFNSSENPDETNRTVSFTVNDGDDNSLVVARVVTLEAIDTTEAVLDGVGNLGALNVTGALYIDPSNFDTGVTLIGSTLYIIGTDGRDDVKLKFNEKKDELKVDVKLNQGGSDGGSDGGHHKGKHKGGSDGGKDKGKHKGGSDGGSDGGGKHIKQTFAISAIDRIVTYLCAGKDKLNGGRGNDLLIGGSAENENALASLEAAMADWGQGGLAAALLDLGSITDDHDKDGLKGGKGIDKLIGGVGDKLKQ